MVVISKEKDCQRTIDHGGGGGELELSGQLPAPSAMACC